MNATTYATRTKPHRGTVALQMVQDWIRTGKPIRPCRLTGRGKRTANDDHSSRVLRILDALRVKYTTGNDAPRGGLTGQWIAPDCASWRKLQPVREAWIREQEEGQRRDMLEDQMRLARLSALYAAKLEPWSEVLLTWWREQQYHPAPEPVLKAKQESGLSWSQVRTWCRANA